MELLDAQTWDALLLITPKHILQTSPGDFKADFGWKPRFVRQGQLGALVLFRRLLGLTMPVLEGRSGMGIGKGSGIRSTIFAGKNMPCSCGLNLISGSRSKQTTSAQLPGFMETNKPFSRPHHPDRSASFGGRALAEHEVKNALQHPACGKKRCGG